nr:pectinesterase 2-like [Ipomoea trifida]
MARKKIETMRINQLVMVSVLLHYLCPGVVSDDSIPIPASKDEVNSWFTANVQPPSERKNLDPALAKAESNPKHIRVSKDGKGDFKTINEALDTVPNGNTQRVIISLGPGNYTERLKIVREKPFITLHGDDKDRPSIIYGSTAAQDGTVYSATVIVEADYFMAVSVNIINSAPRPDGVRKGAQAVALTQSGDKAAFYGVRLHGFQDTFCDDKGRHFFKDSYIEGTVDFIFGNGKTLYVDTELHVIEGDNMAVITAQARHTKAEDTGYSFAHCKVTGVGEGALLGRGWMAFSRVIFAYTVISDAIKPEGWHGVPGKTHYGGNTYFGEYMNTGPGAKMEGRPNFVKKMTQEEVNTYVSLGFIEDDTVPIPQQKAQVESWFKANVQPLASRKGLDPALTKAEAAAVHIGVGKGGKFKTIQEAVNSIPKKNTKRYIINIAGGTYKERVKIDYDKPFITFYGDPKSRPLIDAAGTAAQFGTIESATVQVLSDYFMAVNIDFKNSAPRPSGKPGQQAVALTIAGDKAAFYNCKFFGFQDTLCDNINKHFYKDCYVEGTVDFFFGSAKTIILSTEMHVIPGDTMDYVTAHARKSEKEDSGYSFVQCRVTGDAKSRVAYLGRIWYPFAKTIFSYSDISAAIRPEGWLGIHNSRTDGAVTSDDTVPIPQQKSEVEGWFKANVHPLPVRKGLDPALAKAEAAPVHIAVGKGGKFKTIQEAVDSIPAKNTKRTIINIAGGTYKERVRLDVGKHFVTFYGDPKNRPLIDAAATAAEVGTVYSATLYVLSDYFMAVNINVKNSAPRPTGKPNQQAVALTITGDRAAFYNCKFYGFQDTVCDNINKHFYKDCYIEGTVDFFFGDAKTLIVVRDNIAMVTAHGRKSANEDTGLSFVQCRVTGDAKSKIALLGRAWYPFAKTVFAYSDLCGSIRPEGWWAGMSKNVTNPNTFFGEYKNTGPGSSMAKRAKFVKRLTDAEAKQYLTLGFIQASKWLLPPITKAVQDNSTQIRSKLQLTTLMKTIKINSNVMKV